MIGILSNQDEGNIALIEMGDIKDVAVFEQNHKQSVLNALSDHFDIMPDYIEIIEIFDVHLYPFTLRIGAKIDAQRHVFYLIQTNKF